MTSEFPLSPKVVTLISNQTLTSSWTSTGSFGFMATEYANFLGLLIKYTKGGETGLEVKVEGTADVSLGIATSVALATNWFQQVTGTLTAGQNLIVPAYYEMQASGNYSEVIYPIKGDGVKVSVQADSPGGSAGTVTIYGITSWV